VECARGVINQRVGLFPKRHAQNMHQTLSHDDIISRIQRTLRHASVSSKWCDVTPLLISGALSFLLRL